MGRNAHLPKSKIKTLRYTNDGKCQLNIPIGLPRNLGWKDGDQVLIRIMPDYSIRIFNLYHQPQKQKIHKNENGKIIITDKKGRIEITPCPIKAYLKKRINYSSYSKYGKSSAEAPPIKFLKEEDFFKWSKNRDLTKYKIDYGETKRTP